MCVHGPWSEEQRDMVKQDTPVAIRQRMDGLRDPSLIMDRVAVSHRGIARDLKHRLLSAGRLNAPNAHAQ